MAKEEIVLAGCGYFVEVADEQVIFTESRGFFGRVPRTLVFVRPPMTPNFTPGCWSIDVEGAHHPQISAEFVVAAYEYCQKRYGENFKPYQWDAPPIEGYAAN